MSRYIVGTVKIFGELLEICWDTKRAHLDAVEPTAKHYLAGPEAPPAVRALIEQELEVGIGQLNKLEDYRLELSATVPVWLRHRHERDIAERLVTDAIAAGCDLSVYDGEVWTVERSRDAKGVMLALFSTGEDVLCLHQEGRRLGHFHLITGNDGWDLIADSSYKAEAHELMVRIERQATELASAIENKYGY